MASTSTQLQDGASLLSGSSSWPYDVFLSFKGEDTRNGFVDHLYCALYEKAIFTFKDDQRLETGESISPALLKAIEESRFAVVVFFENYASSKWCLEELVYILECQKTRGLTVLPVFYKVDPSDLRKQRGSIGEAFARHEQDSNEEEKVKVQRWRNALEEAANIVGWDSGTHRLEAKLVRNIAIDILNRLGNNGSCIIPKDVVGLRPRMEEVISLLGSDLDDPRIVGICGMGGIGKTTIAKAVYCRIRSQFNASSYCENVRERFEKNGLESLQKCLLADICSILGSDIQIRNIDLLGTIRKAVWNKRVLIVLDDVDDPKQLKDLVETLDWFGRGCKIIITTRNSHLLAKYGPRGQVYNVEGLNDEEASNLFCCKAFWNNQPMLGFEHLIKSAVDYAQGVPLALEVLGCFLIGRGVNEWQSAINRLRQEPYEDVQKVLKLSYEGLGSQDKQIFLDFACFFKQYYSIGYNTVVTILDACDFNAVIGISVLEQRALVTRRDNMIHMHDLIQEMGWHIVNEESPREPGRRSRLWKYKDIYHTLTKKRGTETVEAIVLNSNKTKEMVLSSDAFSNMSKLRLLSLHGVQLPNGLDYLSNDLCLLDWHGYPLRYLPSNFQPDSLVKLRMVYSCLKQPWNGRMCLDKLKYADFSDSRCIAKILDFTQVENLEELILQDCTSLVEIGPSIRAIKRITKLDLGGCKYLKVLPTGCWLKSLKHLSLCGCLKLKNVSDVLAFTECLITIDVSETCVKELPVEHLSNLEEILADSCKELTSLPSGICGLKRLQSLSVDGCSKLSKLPERLGDLESLWELCVGFTAIKQLPSSIIHLKKLKWLSCSGCKGGVMSTPWNSLLSSFLIRTECEDPMGFELPLLSGLSSLTELNLCNCILLEGLLPSDLGSLSSLKSIDLSGSNIISLPASIRGLYGLCGLRVTDCEKLKTLLYLPPNVEWIIADGCTSLETLPDPPMLPRNLWEINLGECHTLLKNRPNLPLELFRNYVKAGFGDFPRCRIVVPGREIPEWFSYQNNKGHCIRIPLKPDWYQRLGGLLVCSVFEGMVPSTHYCNVSMECYGMCNDVVDFAMDIFICSFEFQSDQLFFNYILWSKIGKKATVNDLKTWTEIIFYYKCYSCPYAGIKGCDECVPIAKCAVHMEYKNDGEWPDPCASFRQSDCYEFGSIEGMQGVVLKKRSCHDYDHKADTREQPNPKRRRDDAAQGRDSQSQLSELSIQNIRDSVMAEFEDTGYYCRCNRND